MKLPKENFLRVKRNLSGTVGLLKTVNLPHGGTLGFALAQGGQHRKNAAEQMGVEQLHSG